MSGQITFISAGAGSGKTYRLTEILQGALTRKTDAIRPSGVIATTFTKRAAAELRERVRSHLGKNGHFAQAIAMGQARIGTVNSVCGALLERFAFEAGLPPELSVLDELQAQGMLREAIDNISRPDAVARMVTLATRLGIEDWMAEMKAIIDMARANDIQPEALPHFAEQNIESLLGHFPLATADDLDKQALQEAQRLIPVLESAQADKFQKNVQSYINELNSFITRLNDNNLPWSFWPKLEKLSPATRFEDAILPLRAVVSRHAEHPRLHQDMRDYTTTLFALAAGALDDYARRKRELGALDFVDQEQLLLRILDNPHIAKVLNSELDLLMVDEFQDTSPIQLALFMKLAGMAKETYWVGDIKQAIYGFRGSDPRLMLAVLDALPKLDGKIEVLDTSYRSTPALVSITNAAFATAFGNTLPPEQIRLNAHREDIPGLIPFQSWRLKGSKADEQWQALAAGVARLMAQGIHVEDKSTRVLRSLRFSDIAILARQNTNVTKIAAALSDHDIPAQTAQPGLLGTPEAVLALACLRRLNDDADTIATAEILSLAAGQEPETWLADRLQWVSSHDKSESGNWKESGEDADPLLSMIAALRKDLAVISPAEAVEIIIAKCGLPAIVLGWSPDQNSSLRRLANLEALIAMAREYEDGCRNRKQPATLSGLLLWFKQQAADDKDSLAEISADAVRVMTHHAAKGLEWPVVILTELHAELRDRLWGLSATSRAGFDAGNPLHGRFLRYWPWPYGKQSKMAISDQIDASAIAQEFRADAAEEAKRLLYVSMTRPRDLLIFAHQDKAPSGPWLETLACPWLLPDDKAEHLTLPDGQQIACQCLEIDSEPVVQSALKAEAIKWPTPPQAISHFEKLYANPSAAEPISCAVAEKITIGTPVVIDGSPNMADLGVALHSCIAAAVIDQRADIAEHEISLCLERMGIRGKIDPAHLKSQIDAFIAWCKSRWNITRWLAEVPVQYRLPNGRITRGQIDLLLEVGDEWILIDHKSSQGGTETWDASAAHYSGQLAAYSEAVEKTTRCKVVETWLHYPVAGGAARVQF